MMQASAASMMLAGAASDVSGTWRFDGFEVSLLVGLSPEREEWERALLSAGRALPLPHRSAWAALHSPFDSWFIKVSDATGRPCGAAALQVAPSRALPGHLIVRCERFGPGVSAGAQRAALQALVAIARQRHRVLRLCVETFAIDPVERAALEGHAQALGFVRVRPPRSYENTLLISLERDEKSIFASIHRTARQNVRAVDKNPMQVRPVEDSAHFDRLDEISRETYARTGGAYTPADWSRIVALSAREPAASRLVGLYRTDISGPASLLAYAWGCGHGDHVHYSRGGSTRATDVRISLTYPLVWDLICWAKRSGARYFDFGGVTVGSNQSDDPLGGISDFKRAFSKHLEQVGAEWSLEPRPVQARAARFVSSASSLVARVLTRSRRPAHRALQLSTRPTALGTSVIAGSPGRTDPASRDGRL